MVFLTWVSLKRFNFYQFFATRRDYVPNADLGLEIQ